MPALTRAGAISREKAPALAPVFNGYTLFWIFFSAAFAGALTETAFMLLTRGELQSRSSLLYGQLSLVWGLGAVLFTLLLHRLWEGNAGRLFLAGALGAAPVPRRWGLRLADRWPVLETLSMAALRLLCTAYLVDGSFNPFLYVRF